jgi:hypothetical protein
LYERIREKQKKKERKSEIGKGPGKPNQPRPRNGPLPIY